MNRLPAIDLMLHDGPCIFVNKPGGVLTQGPPGVDSMELRVKQYIREQETKDGKVYLGTPHRLDRPVSGVMVFARHARAAKRISAQFERRNVKKTYWAIVNGCVESDSGRWIDHLLKVEGEARSLVVDADTPKAQEAILNYTVVQRSSDKTWLEIELETGRTHQIRVQCSTRNHPILGDVLYDSENKFGPVTSNVRERCIGLHARQLALPHPMEVRDVDVKAPVPSYWLEVACFDFENPQTEHRLKP